MNGGWKHLWNNFIPTPKIDFLFTSSPPVGGQAPAGWQAGCLLHSGKEDNWVFRDALKSFANILLFVKFVVN